MPPAAGSALLFMTLGELAIAFSDVVIDGVVVECSRGADQATAGSLQSICWGSQARLLSSHPRSLPVAAHADIRRPKGLVCLACKSEFLKSISFCGSSAAHVPWLSDICLPIIRLLSLD